MRDNTDVVAGVKAALEARGVNLAGPCGAFEITRRVAWALRADGAGLLTKTTGNHCNGFAVDVVFFHDGVWVDVLINSETENRPAWQVGPTQLDVSRWAAPADPGDDGHTEVAGTVPAASPSDEIERLISIGEHIVDAIEELVGTIEALDRRLADVQQRGVRLRL